MTALPAPATSAQRMQALQRANEIRIARATLKRQIAAGRTSAAQAILSGPPEIEGMAVIELLRSQRSWGHARCRGLMMAIPLSENKTIGSMTDRQQSLLLAMLQAENQPPQVDRSPHNRLARRPRQALPG